MPLYSSFSELSIDIIVLELVINISIAVYDILFDCCCCFSLSNFAQHIEFATYEFPYHHIASESDLRICFGLSKYYLGMM
jgi:hypothetical protein